MRSFGTFSKRSWLGYGVVALVVFKSTTLLAGEVELGTRNLFIPHGFDDNDEASIVVDTELPSSCYALLEPRVKVDLNQRVISVEAIGKRSDTVCLPVMTPTYSEVHLGILPHGTYRVVTNNGWLVDELVVAEATNAGPDDFRYALVKGAWLDYGPDRARMFAEADDSRYSVVVEATKELTCERLDRLQVIDSGAVFEVMLIMTIDESISCEPVKEDFVARAFLPELEHGRRYLLHVRSQNGQALNRVVQVE